MCTLSLLSARDGERKERSLTLTNLWPFLQHHNPELFSLLLLQLLQTNGSAEAGRPGTDDAHIYFVLRALDLRWVIFFSFPSS